MADVRRTDINQATLGGQLPSSVVCLGGVRRDLQPVGPTVDRAETASRKASTVGMWRARPRPLS
jgi:hypothetical protein